MIQTVDTAGHNFVTGLSFTTKQGYTTMARFIRTMHAYTHGGRSCYDFFTLPRGAQPGKHIVRLCYEYDITTPVDIAEKWNRAKSKHFGRILHDVHKIIGARFVDEDNIPALQSPKLGGVPKKKAKSQLVEKGHLLYALFDFRSAIVSQIMCNGRQDFAGEEKATQLTSGALRRILAESFGRQLTDAEMDLLYNGENAESWKAEFGNERIVF